MNVFNDKNSASYIDKITARFLITMLTILLIEITCQLLR